MSIKRSDCSGCRNEFYHSGCNNIGVNGCWSFKDAKMDKGKFDIHIDSPPPYTKERGYKVTRRPECYHASRMVRVSPDNLTKDGFWR